LTAIFLAAALKAAARFVDSLISSSPYWVNLMVAMYVAIADIPCLKGGILPP
jgi:hypothetical protein